jgi:hypothetical protein
MFVIVVIDNGDDDPLISDDLRPTTSSNINEVKNKITTNYIFKYIFVYFFLLI